MPSPSNLEDPVKVGLLRNILLSPIRIGSLLDMCSYRLGIGLCLKCCGRLDCIEKLLSAIVVSFGEILN